GRVRGSAFGPHGCGRLPGVVGRTLDLDELAQSLHRVGGGIVGNELEATHQRVSPAKYFAAFCKISRSVASFVVSTRKAAFSASRRAIFCCGVSPAGPVALADTPLERVVVDRNGLDVRVPSVAVFLPVPYASSQPRNVPRTIPRSSAIPRTV